MRRETAYIFTYQSKTDNNDDKNYCLAIFNLANQTRYTDSDLDWVPLRHSISLKCSLTSKLLKFKI